MKPKFTISHDVSLELKPQLNALILLLGYDPSTTMVTDLSTFLDFMCMFTYPTLADANAMLTKWLKEAGLDIELCAGDTLISAAARILQQYPAWPHNTQHIMH
jgi:hypothetical protein